jgi:hypothetical protein
VWEAQYRGGSQGRRRVAAKALLVAVVPKGTRRQWPVLSHALECITAVLGSALCAGPRHLPPTHSGIVFHTLSRAGH